MPPQIVFLGFPFNFSVHRYWNLGLEREKRELVKLITGHQLFPGDQCYRPLADSPIKAGAKYCIFMDWPRNC